MKTIGALFLSLFLSLPLMATTWQTFFEREQEALKKDSDRRTFVERAEAVLPTVSEQDRPYFVTALLIATQQEDMKKEKAHYKAEVLQHADSYAKLSAEPFFTLFNCRDSNAFPGMSALALLADTGYYTPEERTRLKRITREVNDPIAYGMVCLKDIKDVETLAEFDTFLNDPFLPAEFRAYVYYMKAKFLKHNDPEAAVQNLRNGLSLARLHDTRVMLQEALNEIRQTEVTIIDCPAILPPGVSTFTIKYINTDALEIRYSGCVNTTQTIPLPAPEKRYQWASTTIETPAFPIGSVHIEFIPRTTFHKTAGQSVARDFTINTFNVSLLCETPPTFLITDTLTGLPAPDVFISIKEKNASFSGFTDKHGLLRIGNAYRFPSDSTYTFIFQKGDRILELPITLDTSSRDHTEEAILLTDRTIYRPGDTVHWQLFARTWKQGDATSTPWETKRELSFTGRAPSGKTFEEIMQVKTSDAGTASGSFVLPKDFSGRLRVKFANSHLDTYINVFEYRANMLQMTLEASSKYGRWDEPLTLSGTLFDLTGTPADGASLTLTYTNEKNEKHKLTGVVAANGTFSFTFLPTLCATSEGDTMETLEVSIDAVASNGESTSEFKHFKLLRYGYQPELSISTWNVEGEPFSVELLPLPLKGRWAEPVRAEVLPVVKGTLAIYRDAYSAEAKPIQELPISSEAPISLTLPAGEYKAKFVSSDALTTYETFAVLPKTHSPTCFPERDALLLFNRKLSSPVTVGDTLQGFAWTRSATPANVYILTAKGVHAVLPVETPLFELPITEALAGGFQVLLLGFDKSQILEETYRVSEVLPKPLTLTMTRFEEKTRPSTTQQWELTINDPTAEVLLTCYDAALDSVSPYSWRRVQLPRPTLGWFSYKSLFSQEALTFGETLPRDFAGDYYQLWDEDEDDASVSWDSENNRVMYDKSFGAGVGYYSEVITLSASACVLKAPAASAESPEKEPPSARVRRDFSTTALWAPQRRVTDNKVTYTFTLPDTMTTWKVMALAYTPDGRQGVLEQECIASAPVILKPYLPRFMRRGDTITAELAITNTTDTPLTTHVECNASQRQSIELPPKETRTLSWLLTAPQEGDNFVVTFTSPEDAVELTLPVLPDKILCEEVFPITLQDTTPFTLDLSTLPRDAELQWHWETSPTDAVVESLKAVIDSKCESSESRFARIMAMIFLARLTDTEVPDSLERDFYEFLDMRTGAATWPWVSGGQTSLWSTATIATGCARLARLNALPDELAEIFKHEDLSLPIALDAYTATLCKKPIPESSVTAELMQTRLSEACSRNEARMLTVAALEHHHPTPAAMGLQRIREAMSSSPTWGNWWQTRTPAWWRWLDDPLYHHALCMEALHLAEDKENVKRAALWLLQHRRFNQWGSPSTTITAAYALLQSDLTFEPTPDIAVTRDETSITFRRPTAGLTFGRLIATFTADPTQLQTHPQDERLPVTLETQWQSEHLRVGDTLEGTITLHVAQDMERLILEVPRPANTEPDRIRPRRALYDDLFVYSVPGDSGVTLYIENLPRGKHTLPFTFRVTHAGTCTAAPIRLTPFAAPDFTLYAPALRLSTTR